MKNEDQSVGHLIFTLTPSLFKADLIHFELHCEHLVFRKCDFFFDCPRYYGCPRCKIGISVGISSDLYTAVIMIA